MEFPKSVEAYADNCEAVWSWLKSDDWLHQDQFDELSRAWRRENRPCRVVAYTNETVLPPIFGGDLNLVVLQEMQAAKLVEGRTRPDGSVEYRIAGTNTGS